MKDKVGQFEMYIEIKKGEKRDRYFRLKKCFIQEANFEVE
jgi:hypothetical protein